jgi:hypothetical protein
MKNLKPAIEPGVLFWLNAFVKCLVKNFQATKKTILLDANKTVQNIETGEPFLNKKLLFNQF